MMLFKNGVPVGYGGGWPFLGTCRIGVNVFAPFRGGESALLFGEVLRVYRQCFGVGRFVAEPSQFGGTNREGLRSGAFWFYYRLGFRPVEPEAARRASDEWSRMQADPDYRTPESRLRRFTDSDIELRLDPAPEIETEPLERPRDPVDRRAIRRRSCRRAARGYRARRPGARRPGPKPLAEGRGARLRDAVAARRADFRSRRLAARPDRRSLVLLMRAKGGDEFRFHDRLRRHRRFAPRCASSRPRGARG